MKTTVTFSCVLLFCQLIDASQDDVKSVAIITRHGDRFPCEAYNNDPYSELFKVTGYGGLTPFGRAHMYRVGHKLRKLFPALKKRTVTRLTSSRVPRVVDSIRYLFKGLVGPSSFLSNASIEVNTTLQADDAMLNHGALNCPARKRQREQSRLYSNVPNEFADVWTNLTKISGTFYGEIPRFVDFLIEPVVSEKLMGLPMPDWATDELHERGQAAIDRTIFVTGSLDIVGRLSGLFYKEIIDRFTEASKAHGVSFHAYGTHDTTLGPILVNLGLWPGHRPYYGEALVLVLTQGGQIKAMFYDEKHVLHPKVLPGCSQSRCTIGSFRQAVENLIPVNWKKDCNRTD